MRGGRRGVSLIEVLVIAMVLGVVAIPFLQSFGSFTRSMHRTTRHTGAIYVAQSIMEQIRNRIMLSSDLGAEVAALGETSSKVVTEGGAGGSQYFLSFENLEGEGLHGITRETDPNLYIQLSHYTCEVQILTGTEVSIYEAGQGNPEDLVEIGVTVKWQAPMGDERIATLWTVLTSYRGGYGT